MKKFRKILSVTLAVIMACSCCVVSFASDGEAKGYSVFAKAVDKALGVAHDGLFGILQGLTPKSGVSDDPNFIPEMFYAGTNGVTTGEGWQGGFAKSSVIPKSWRCDAEGKQDDNGMCLNKKYATGGYQTKVSKLYTDQMLNLVILSNGSDSNQNGKEDLLIFISVDGVGITAGTCAEIRKNVEKALASKGYVKGDILGINVSATHCHAGLDIQGMCITTLFNNKIASLFTGDDYIRSLDKDMELSIESAAFDAAKEAIGKMESGKITFFETDKVSGASDKLHSGVKTVNHFSCFLFEGENENTIISNIGAHPTSYGAWDNRQLMCTDYPYFLSMALKDLGYNLVFTQSSQACVSSPGVATKDYDDDAAEYVKTKHLTKEQWVQMYGEKYADKWYDDLEENMNNRIADGYKIARFILSAKDNNSAKELTPTLRVKNRMSTITLDYGVMAWGGISGLLGEYGIKMSRKDSETGYGLRVETDLIEFDSVAILTAPGELSPALAYGTAPDYDGTALWTGITSWQGKDWEKDCGFKTLETYGKEALGQEKTIIIMGITNDALGYMFPDINPTDSILGALMFYKEASDDMCNCMLMTVGTKVGSQLCNNYKALLESTPVAR